MGSNVLIRPDNAIYIAWQACNPHIPYPRQLGELAEPVIPDSSPPTRHRALKETRKPLPVPKPTIARPPGVKTPRRKSQILAEARRREKRLAERLRAQASVATAPVG